MYQMMIIDDEPIVRAGLRELLDWEDLGFHVCAEGADGRDGLEKLLLHRPDLVLIDVKMPGMSGLDVIREAKAQGFRGTFIILTGYSDFEFAKTAVALGVRAYLLKPIEEEELLDSIQEVLHELDAQKDLEAYYGRNELKARHDMLRGLLLSAPSQEPEQCEAVKKELERYGFDFHHKTYCVALLPRDGDLWNEAEETKEEEKLNTIVKSLGHFEKVELEGKWVIIIKGSSYREMEKRLSAVNERLKTLYGSGFFIAIGHDVSYAWDLHFSYECASMLLEYRFLYGSEAVVTIALLEQTEECENMDFVQRLCGLIEVGGLEEIAATVHELGEEWKNSLKKEQDIKIQMVHAMIQLQSQFSERYLQKRAELPKVDELTAQIRNTASLPELMEMLISYARRVSEIIGTVGSETVVKRMHAYMEKNYAQDLKLDSIAKLFGYNSAYLGKVFKREMGESFNNVLDHLRIDNAKRLLTDTDLKVYQVSERVGFSNIDYFYAKFKRYVGVSPKEFRQAREEA